MDCVHTDSDERGRIELVCCICTVLHSDIQWRDERVVPRMRLAVDARRLAGAVGRPADPVEQVCRVPTLVEEELWPLPRCNDDVASAGQLDVRAVRRDWVRMPCSQHPQCHRAVSPRPRTDQNVQLGSGDQGCGDAHEKPSSEKACAETVEFVHVSP